MEALRYKNVPAKLDDRRQPTQPPAYITGNVPAEFVNSIKGNWGAVGSQLIDEYLMPSSRGVSPSIQSLVQIQNGQATNTVNSAATLTRSSFNGLRANTNGLTNIVWFYVNGKLVLDDRAAPFEIPAGSLVNGNNELLVISHANGQHHGQSIVRTLFPLAL